MSRTTESARLGRHLPWLYLVLALVLLVVALPTTLRPPADQSPASAELSPDAPPDDSQEALVASLNRGISATAGAGEVAPGGENASLGLPAGLDGPPPATQLRPRACPGGFGEPPRQTESLYSPPCATGFSGDNGGETWQGVTATEVRLGIATQNGTYQTSYDGEVPPDPPPGESAKDRTYRVYQEYFNQAYQLYGRTLRFYTTTGTQTEEAQRAKAVRLDEEYEVFGVNGYGRGFEDEAIRRGLVLNGIHGRWREFFDSTRPYTYGWIPDGDQLIEFTSEFLCKQLVGRRAGFTEDPSLSSRTRELGLMFLDGGQGAGSDTRFDKALSACGAELETAVMYDIFGAEGQSNLATGMARMRADGVTTVICHCDYFTASAVVEQANASSYFPEWIVPGLGNLDQNIRAQAYDSAQWRHAFGVTALEIPQPTSQRDWYRAYKQIDPSGEPNFDVASTQFHILEQMVAGLQLAGPILTPETYERGMLRQPRRRPDPPWAMAGGYAPGDYTYADYFGIIWWDPTATAIENGQPGAYRFVRDGQRFAMGEIPTAELPLFDSGIASIQ